MSTSYRMGVCAVASVVSLVVSGVPAWAHGLRNPPEGAAALGHDGGKVVLVDDASAIAHNPANLADLKQGQVLPAVTLIHSDTKFTSPAGSAETDDPWKVLPNVFAAWPVDKGNYVVGFGLTTPFGQSTVWDGDGAFRYSAPYKSEMTVVDFNPTLATRLTDRLAIGAGVDAYWSQIGMKQRLPWAMMTGNPMSPEGIVDAEGDGVGFGANAALSYKLTDRQTVALTYRCPFRIRYEGTTDISEMPPAAQAMGLSPSSDFDTSIDFPAIAALGYGLALSDTVKVGADVEWVQSSRYENLQLDAKNNNALLNPPGSPSPMQPLVIPQKWDDSWTAGAGVDWKAFPAVTLRAGYRYLDSPVPEATFGPMLPDCSRHVVTAGIGYTHAAHRVDLAYGYSIIPDRDIHNDQNPAYNGTYETSSHLFGLSYGYTF